MEVAKPSGNIAKKGGQKRVHPTLHFLNFFSFFQRRQRIIQAMPIINDLHSNTLHKKKNKNKNSKEYVKIIFGATRGIFGQKKKKV